MTYTYNYPRPCVTVDAVILHHQGDDTKILLIKRKNEPFRGMWAIPGGFVDMDETCDHAAARELEEETSLTGIPLTQFRTYSAIDRDPRHRTISVVYYALLKQSDKPNDMAGDDAAESGWFSISALPPLAFDHDVIITELLQHLGMR